MGLKTNSWSVLLKYLFIFIATYLVACWEYLPSVLAVLAIVCIQYCFESIGACVASYYSSMKAEEWRLIYFSSRSVLPPKLLAFEPTSVEFWFLGSFVFGKIWLIPQEFCLQTESKHHQVSVNISAHFLYYMKAYMTFIASEFIPLVGNDIRRMWLLSHTRTLKDHN